MPGNAHDVEPLSCLTDLRPLMSVTHTGVYLDHAAAGPMPEPVAEAMKNRISSAADFGVRHWNHWQKQVDRTRRLAADLVGGSSDEIAFVPNTAAGIGIIAEGYPWHSGDNVVLSSAEFPSNRFPWMHLRRRGIEVRLVDTPESAEGFAAAIDGACDSHTRIVACSWVDYGTGVRRNAEQLSAHAHRHGALLVLDAVQGLGVLPIDLAAQGVDALVSDSRKWILGPEGAGIMAVCKEHFDRFDLTRIGWAGMARPMDFTADRLEFSQTARRFESGMHNTFGIAGLFAALRLLKDISAAERECRLLEVRATFVDAAQRVGLLTADLPEAAQSGIISFDTGGRPASALEKHLQSIDITVNLRNGRVRVSPHVYNNDHDAARFAAAVADWRTIT